MKDLPLALFHQSLKESALFLSEHWQSSGNKDEVMALLCPFGEKPIIVKDYVKSRKSVFQSVADRDGALQSGMEEGLNDSYERLTELLETME